MLFIEGDSALCSKSPRGIEYFLQLDVDFIGAPWKRDDCGPGKQFPVCVGNSGLGLVDRRMMLKLIKQVRLTQLCTIVLIVHSKDVLLRPRIFTLCDFVFVDVRSWGRSHSARFSTCGSPPCYKWSAILQYRCESRPPDRVRQAACWTDRYTVCCNAGERKEAEAQLWRLERRHSSNAGGCKVRTASATPVLRITTAWSRALSNSAVVDRRVLWNQLPELGKD